jgi:hypothetical protein
MSCSIIENIDLPTHEMCMKIVFVYHVCHMTKLVKNEKYARRVATCIRGGTSWEEAYATLFDIVLTYPMEVRGGTSS